MNDKYNSFYNQTINQSIEKEDSIALDQCMDLIFAWCDVLSIPREAVRHQYAYQVWDQANDTTKQYFDLLLNTPTFIPQMGDIAVFKQIAGIPVGHVSIDTGKSDINNLITLDQNWDTIHYYHIDPKTGARIPYTRVVNHYGYYGCIGFLRPKLLPVGDDVLLNQIQAIVNGSGTPQDKILKIREVLK
ncbi:MAG: hypothetical protein PHE73_08870 [Sulfurovaceae bacterium]|nr:hypothetical protein [Sulfurovaceae bacterium]